MSEAREIELKPIVDRVGEPDYVLIGPDDPEGMLRHTDECRQRGYRFVADPSQQLAFGDGEMIRRLIDGADILFSNEYEASLITQKTGWSADEVLSPRRHLGRHARRRGRPDRPRGRGVRSSSPRSPRSRRSSRPVSATRSGPASSPRSTWDLDLERAAQLGCLLAVYVVEQVGTQEYTLSRAAFLGALRGDVRRRGGRRRRAAPAHHPLLTCRRRDVR